MTGITADHMHTGQCVGLVVSPVYGVFRGIEMSMGQSTNGGVKSGLLVEWENFYAHLFDPVV